MNKDIQQLCNNKEEFLVKWGKDWQSVIVEFIEKSPEFKGDVELAKKIGYLVADIQSVIELKK